MPFSVSRVAAALGFLSALAACLSALSLSAFSMLVAAQRPDPAIPDGDPCCGHPDTWGEVVQGVGYGVALSLIGGGLLLLAAILLAIAVTGRSPAWTARTSVRRLGVGWALVVLVLLAWPVVTD